ncbi:penicillin-binding protein 2 [soil metagenome]
MQDHGIAFGDHIKSEKMHRRYKEGNYRYHMRGFFLLVFLCLGIGVLFIKVFSLQLVHGAYYRDLADSNRMRTRVIHAPRGVIFDRNKIPLVFNIPGFRQVSKDTSKIISREESLALLAKGATNLEIDSLRQYPLHDATAHVLGYIGQISKDELQRDEYSTYQARDYLGKAGVEQSYESMLRGTNGKQLIEIDAMGKPTRTLGQTDPIPGQDITITLDSKLQAAAYEAMRTVKKGALIVSTPDGQILSLISKPSYDPNLFTMDESYKVASDSSYQKLSQVLLDGDTHPLLNRAIAGTYPPGSTFKIVTAASGLQNKIIDEKYTIVDTGVLTVGTFSYANWFYIEYGRKEEGEIDVRRALARSNDIYFYKLAEKIGPAKLAEMSLKMGAGAVTGIDLYGEAKGIIPTETWKKAVIKEPWYLGDTFHYGIGQGFVLTTPLQVNTWTQVVANGGTLYEPRLLQAKKDSIKAKNILDEKTLGLIREGMIEACSPKGVAWPLFEFKVKNTNLKIDNKDIFAVEGASGSAEMRKVSIACKTGTAQHGGEQTLPHAWITLFAPANKPEIVVTVLNESSGEGSNEAAPVAKKILEAWFGEKK